MTCSTFNKSFSVYLQPCVLQASVEQQALSCFTQCIFWTVSVFLTLMSLCKPWANTEISVVCLLPLLCVCPLGIRCNFLRHVISSYCRQALHKVLKYPKIVLMDLHGHCRPCVANAFSEMNVVFVNH